MSRLKEKYSSDVVPALRKEFGYKNVMAVPRISKVVVNMGLGEGTQNAKIVDTGAEELTKITGQKASITRATKSIAQFKVRKGMPIGAMAATSGSTGMRPCSSTTRTSRSARACSGPSPASSANGNS